MPVVNREVVLPVTRGRAWELVAGPGGLETWLADEVDFEPEEGAPLRTEEAARSARAWSSTSNRGRIVFIWGDSIVEWRLDDHPDGTRFPVLEHRFTGDDAIWGPRLEALASAGGLCRCLGDDRIGAVFIALADPTRRQVVRALARPAGLAASWLAGKPPDVAAGGHEAPGGVGPRRARARAAARVGSSLHADARAAGRGDGLDGRRRRPLGPSAREAGGAARDARRARHRGGGRHRPRGLRAADRRRPDVLGVDLERPRACRARRSRPTSPPARATGRGRRRARGASAGSNVIVANAGLQHVAPVEEFPEDKWDQLLAIMLSHPFLLARYGWEALEDVGPRGRFIAIASAHALAASPFKAGYVSAKHGVLGLVKTLALEGAESRACAPPTVCPGYVRTPLVENQIPDQAKSHGISEEEALEQVILAPHAIKRLIEPDEVAGVVAFLAGWIRVRPSPGCR